MRPIFYCEAFWWWTFLNQIAFWAIICYHNFFRHKFNEFLSVILFNDVLSASEFLPFFYPSEVQQSDFFCVIFFSAFLLFASCFLCDIFAFRLFANNFLRENFTVRFFIDNYFDVWFFIIRNHDVGFCAILIFYDWLSDDRRFITVRFATFCRWNSSTYFFLSLETSCCKFSYWSFFCRIFFSVLFLEWSYMTFWC